MKNKTRSAIGRMSRNKGKRFERQCREIMADISGWPYWKRTQRGDKQWQGDLEMCHEDGQKRVGIYLAEEPTYYVECRARATLTADKIIQWVQEVEAMWITGGIDRGVLICKQDRGPVLAICSWEQEIGRQLNARIY